MSVEKNLFLEIAPKYLKSVSFVMNYYYASYIKVVYNFIFICPCSCLKEYTLT